MAFNFIFNVTYLDFFLVYISIEAIMIKNIENKIYNEIQISYFFFYFHPPTINSM